MASTVILKAAGLYTSPNQLSLPDGALTEASNVVIKRDGIVEQRRGFKLYGNSAEGQAARFKQLTTYRNRIIRHIENTLQYDADGSGDFRSFTGTFQNADDDYRMKFIEASGNLFFTTANGIQKISARTTAGLSTAQVYKAGAAKAIDIEAKPIYTPNLQTGFLPQDSAVAYRVLWGYKDTNNNLILGAPSQREIVYNYQLDNMLKDYMRFLDVLDSFTNSPLTAARINDKNYVSTLGVDITATASDLRSKLIALSTKLDEDIFLADQSAVAPLQISSATITSGVCTITVSGANANDYVSATNIIYLSGFSPTTGTLNGAQTVVSSTATTITFNTAATGPVTLSSAQIRWGEFRAIPNPPVVQVPPVHLDNLDIQEYMNTIINDLRGLPDSIVSASDKVLLDPIDLTTTATVQIRITIPQDIDTRYFYQIYRSSIFEASDTQSIDDVIPNDELQLVYESYPTAAELEAGSLTVTDITPDDFRGANLYTNNATGEGILAANDAPPFAVDINRYRNVVFYANTRTKHKSLLNLLGVTTMISDYNLGTIPSVTIATVNGANTYKFVTGQQEVSTITTVADVADSLNGKYFLLDAANGDLFYVWISTGTGVDPAISGRTGIKVSISTGATAANVALAIKNKLSIQLNNFIVSNPTSTTVEITDVDFGISAGAVDVDTGFSFAETQAGRGERVTAEISEINAVAASLYTSSGTADYFTINTALNANRYVVWFKVGTSTDPAISGKTSIQVTLTGSETAAQVAQKIADALPPTQFTTEVVSNTVTVTNIVYGETDNISENVVDAGFTVSTIQQGAVEVLLSTNASPAIAVDETARSLIRVINRNEGDSVYAYYLSGPFDVPGKMLIESRNLEIDDQFFILANNDVTGSSFNPDISPEAIITSITTGLTPTVTTSTAHGLDDLDFVIIGGTDSNPSADGVYEVTVINSTQFTINKAISVAATKGSIIRASTSVTSENEVKPNRIYYSKFLQPEAVPVANFFDVGAEDKKILRIFPLRDSLFVFKEDGLYRISGESAPFQLDLFDSSFIVTAADSVAVCNNVIFAWTTQGIQSLTEGGASVVSRSIDNLILKLGSVNYTNFKTATWGVGYESDNSYLVWTVQNFTDEVAQIGFRFSTLTQTWTTYDKSNTCGIVNSADDKLYLGAGDTNYIEQERKLFDRTDFADREFERSFSNNFLVSPSIVKINNVLNIEPGDVIVQDQTLTVYEYNTLLAKLDLDPSVGDSDYVSSLTMVSGDNPRTKLLALTTKLDADPNITDTNYTSIIADYSGTITSISVENAVITSAAHNLITGRKILITNSNSVPVIDGEYTVTVIDANTFSIDEFITTAGTAGNWQTVGINSQDLKACYNSTINKLNNDNGVSFSNYREIDNNTIMESIVTAISQITKQVTVNLPLQYLVGDITVYKAINSSIQYAPITMGDPLSLKHLREATLMFEYRNITGGTLSFASDLRPELIPIAFNLDGNGIFGHSNFGTGFFGGLSNSAPFRTYIPRPCQRSRFIIAKFEHTTAREDYRLLGATVTGETPLSTRAYR